MRPWWFKTLGAAWAKLMHRRANPRVFCNRNSLGCWIFVAMLGVFIFLSANGPPGFRLWSGDSDSVKYLGFTGGGVDDGALIAIIAGRAAVKRIPGTGTQIRADHHRVASISDDGIKDDLGLFGISRKRLDGKGEEREPIGRHHSGDKFEGVVLAVAVRVGCRVGVRIAESRRKKVGR